MNIRQSFPPVAGELQGFLRAKGITRRAFLKYCASLASLLALPPSAWPKLEAALAQAQRQSVIWLSCQECTGCTESLTRSPAPTLENLIFYFLSLDYHHTLQAAAGEAAEAARREALRRFYGNYLLIVDGSIPLHYHGAACTIAGRSSLDLLQECVQGAAAVIAVGTCAAFGGIPKALPNPTGAASVMTLMDRNAIPRRPLINVPGCPPIPVVISSLLAHYLTFGRFPETDSLARPQVFYGHTLHERCSRLHFFQEQQFAHSFDDAGARQGWCLYELGCKGPLTHNVCTTVKWNEGTSSPIESGHPCIGCSEPDFWDKGGFYQTLLSETPAAGNADREAQSSATRGQAVFEGNCVYCHSPEPPPFRTQPEQVPWLLQNHGIRAHRFTLSDQQIKDLVNYLESLEETAKPR